MEEWEAKYVSTLENAPVTCDTDAKWQKCRGELDVLKYVLNTENSVLAALGGLEETDEHSDRNPLER